MMKILTADKIKELEQRADESGISYLRLMENAGAACAKVIRKRFSQTDKRNVIVVCGKGKNGGDGFVTARKLCENGYSVRVLFAAGRPVAEDSVEMLSRILEMDISFQNYDDDKAEAERSIVSADIIVDAIFGTGFKGAADEKFSRIFKVMSQSGGYVVSIDLPSGMQADKNTADGEIVRADLTIAITALKSSLVYYPSAEFAGEVTVVPIGIPEELLNSYDGMYTMSSDDIKANFTKRREDSNKGDYGKGLIIAGSYEMPGAAVLASSAAVESGAGLVKLAFPDKAYSAVASACPEKVLVPLLSNRFGRISSQNEKRISDELKNCDAVLLGCGLGVDYDTTSICEFVLSNSEVPVIIDADGINALKDNINIIKNSNAPVVITPHPGEAARILGMTVNEVQSDRKAACKAVFEKTGAVSVLKGSRTIITANGIDFFVNITGNSGMAAAGSGDVLSGMILSLICQKIKPFSAAVTAVFLHGMAGDLVSKEYSKMGTTPVKIINKLSKILKTFEK